MIGLYFSGTGNTKYCLNTFLSLINQNAVSYAIENPESLLALKNNSEIILGYPIYFSNIPFILRDFIHTNGNLFQHKKIFIVATMGLFSGDGSGCAARLLRKCGAEIVGGLHLKMPDCIGDEKALKKGTEENKKLILAATETIKQESEAFLQGSPPQNGLSVFSHIAGLFGQRLWFYRKTTSYKEKPVINMRKCVGCGKCIRLCPTNNLRLEAGTAQGNKKCTMCYRCVSFCPSKAITILGKTLHEQCYLEKYVDDKALND